ncbi:MAG: hypothetical protein M1834_001323 [Cirrosporium novae-zelandiae]|nr:MAG: hypothetical protein M1834_001323 [Cirrosporium novae-zelandiae]
MDSMRSLNRSLPKPTQTTEEILQAFKAAALSVTTLYKTAASEQNHAHQTGYQEALEDLLTFLEKEKLGFSEGEGSRIRQWTIQRLDATNSTSDTDEDRNETEKRARSSSPIMQKKTTSESVPASQPSRSTSPVRTGSAPPLLAPAIAPPATPQTTQAPQAAQAPQAPPQFIFGSGMALPQQDTEMQTDTTINNPFDPTHNPPYNPPVRVGVMQRGARSRHSALTPRLNSRLTALQRGEFGNGAGSKRKIHFADFFNIPEAGNGKDWPGNGNKRGKYL